MVYAGISDSNLWHLAINVHIFAASEISGGSYCNRNADSGTETDRAKLIFIW